MNINPLISVILPIYNIENYLTKCMESVFSQTYKNIEIIMIDDGSTDNCNKLCDEYATKDERVIVFHKQNGGLSDARNFGIKRAKGEYITCIDPDDYVDDNYVEYLWYLVNKYHTKMSICQHRVKYENGSIKEHGFLGDELISTKKCLEMMLYHDTIDTSAWAKLYHKSLFETVSYPKGKIFEDIGTTYALMLQNEWIAVGYNSKYTYNIRNNSIVNSNFTINKIDLILMTDKMSNDVLHIYPDMYDAVLRRQVYSRISTLNQMLNVTGYDKERKEIIDFIDKYGLKVRKNPKTPNRDKVALVLLSISYNLYKLCWRIYHNYIINW